MVLKRFMKSLDFRLQCWVWKKIKLHGTQTCKLGFFFGLEEDKLHGTQTYVNSPTRRVWKSVKLHGSQTIQFHLYVTHSIWRGVKLQGAQTDIHYIVKSFKVWKGVKLQDTQTSENQRAAVL